MNIKKAFAIIALLGTSQAQKVNQGTLDDEYDTIDDEIDSIPFPVDKPEVTYLPSDDYPGWVQGSEKGVDVEIIFDYMDSFSRGILTHSEYDQKETTIFEMMNGTPLNGGFLMDYVHLRLVGVPVVHKKEVNNNNKPICHVFYYIKEQCENDRPCFYNEYLEFAFANAGLYDEEKKDGQDFIEWWTDAVASNFGFDFDDVYSIWNRYNDEDNEEEAFDYIEDVYLYGVENGVENASGQTLALYVDGERQEFIPVGAAEWHELLSRYV